MKKIISFAVIMSTIGLLIASPASADMQYRYYMDIPSNMMSGNMTPMSTMMNNDSMMMPVPMVINNNIMDSKMMPMIMNGNMMMLNGKMVQVQLMGGKMMTMMNGQMMPMMMSCNTMTMNGNMTMACSTGSTSGSSMPHSTMNSGLMPLTMNGQGLMRMNGMPITVQMVNGKMMIETAHAQVFYVMMSCSMMPMMVSGKIMPMVMNCNIMPLVPMLPLVTH